jgi:hypothetical protein
MARRASSASRLRSCPRPQPFGGCGVGCPAVGAVEALGPVVSVENPKGALALRCPPAGVASQGSGVVQHLGARNAGLTSGDAFENDLPPIFKPLITAAKWPCIPSRAAATANLDRTSEHSAARARRHRPPGHGVAPARAHATTRSAKIYTAHRLHEPTENRLGRQASTRVLEAGADCLVRGRCVLYPRRRPPAGRRPAQLAAGGGWPGEDVLVARSTRPAG